MAKFGGSSAGRTPISVKFGSGANNAHQFTGSVFVSGALYATEYNVNSITKTITNIEASGSTKFGDSSDDAHEFTGSIYIGDDTKIYFGEDHDAYIEYDEDGTNEFRFAGAAATFEQAVTFDANMTLGNAATDIITSTGQFTASQGIASTLPSYFNNNVTLGNAATDIITSTGQFTASQGGLFGNDIRVSDDVKLYFGTNDDVSLRYDEASQDTLLIEGGNIQIPDDALLYFGSDKDATIYWQSDNDRLVIDVPNAGLTLSPTSIYVDSTTISSGTIAGPGSYIGLSANNQLVLTASGGTTINNATENEIVTVASTTTELDAEANLTFDGSTVRLKGFMSTPVGVFNSSSIDDAVTLPSDYRCLLYGPITIGSQGEFTIGSNSSVKIKSWDDV